MREWVVLELTPQGEDEDPDVLRSSVLRVLRGSEIFVPASVSVVGDSRVVHKLIDNYVFVRRTQPDSYYYKAENTKYIATVLTAMVGKSRQVTTVKDADILKMRKQIQVETDQGIEVGDQVEVMSGVYKGIRAKVIEEILEIDSVQVYISLRSKQAIVTLPRSFLRFTVKEEGAEAPKFSPFRTKYLRIMEWFRRARNPLSTAIPPISMLEAHYSNVVKFGPWAKNFEALVREHTYRRNVDENPIPATYQVEKQFKYVSKLYLAYRLGRDVELAPSLVDSPPIEPVLELSTKALALAKLALPLSLLSGQVGAALCLEDPLRIPDVGPNQTLVEMYCSAKKNFNLLKFQIGQIESKLKKAEQEDAKERKRRASKRHR